MVDFYNKRLWIVDDILKNSSVYAPHGAFCQRFLSCKDRWAGQRPVYNFFGGMIGVSGPRTVCFLRPYNRAAIASRHHEKAFPCCRRAVIASL